MSQEDDQASDSAAFVNGEPRATSAAPEGEPPVDQVQNPPSIPDLEARIAEQAAEIAKYQDLLIRDRAELENFKKRMQRDKAEALRYATEPLVRDLLAVVDNLERALEHANAEDDALVAGVRLVLKSLGDVLERHGVVAIDATDQLFDPVQHEAIAQVESPDHQVNQVVVQHQRGYRLHDRLLRPAMVSVCRRNTADTVASAENRD